MSITARSTVAAVLLAALLSPARGDMIVRSYDDARHDRFYSGGDKAFVGDPYDFSGVGFSSGNTWATLVTDNVFLSATHYHPGNGQTVTFWEGNDLGGVSHTYTVTGGVQVGVSDLWVGWFDSSVLVDPDIARFPVLVLPTAGDYGGLELYNVGLTNFVNGPQKVGRNVVDLAGPLVDFGGGLISSVMVFDYDNSDVPSVGGDETYQQGGDSGGPSFSAFAGGLALLGTHTAIDDSPALSLDTFVPAYVDQVNAILAGRGQSLTLIPESGALWPWLALPAYALASRVARRRRPRAA